MAPRLSDVRAAVKAADPSATVSTRGLSPGAFAIRTQGDPARVRAVAKGLGLSEHTSDIEGPAHDWTVVLTFVGSP